MIRRRLTEAGYQHYEISNFAKPGFECRHNLLYWGPGEYIGCGPAAHSHWNGARYGNRGDLAVYCDRIEKNQPAHTGEEHLAPDAKAREALVMGLRRIRGVDTKTFRLDTGYDVGELCGDPIESLLARGLLIKDDHHLRLADDALFISNSVFSELV
jgi:oxygen-independent coproporphyrinogen-3 oxidase